MVGLVTSWPPGRSTCSWLSFVTCTSPSTTDTREPFTPDTTLNTVPVTATRQSSVATYRCPWLRLAACTMMLPRLSRTVRSEAVAMAEKPDRSRSSTTDPSRNCTIASESFAVRISVPSASSLPAAIGSRLPSADTW